MSMNLKAMKERLNARKKTFEVDNSIFPFWNMDFNEVTSLRLLPYADEMTGGFWAEKKVIPMKFVDPADSSKIVNFKAPCLEMYTRDEKCPVLKHVRALYTEQKAAQNAGDTAASTALKSIANAHWLSNTFYYQGTVRKSTLKEENVPVNPIRVFPFTKKIQGWIMNTVVNNEEDPFERIPTGEFDIDDVHALVGGSLDAAAKKELLTRMQGKLLLLKKAKQGEFADWASGTAWHSQWGPVTDEELAAIEEHGFHDLSKRLPERPTADQYAVMEEMISISIGRMMGDDEGLWNPEWEEVGLKPFRPRNEGGSDSSGGPSYRRPSANTKNESDDSSSEETPKTSVSAVMDKINLARGAKKTETVEAPVETPTETATAEPEPTPDKAEAPAVDSSSSVIARVRARAVEAAKAKAAKAAA